MAVWESSHRPEAQVGSTAPAPQGCGTYLRRHREQTIQPSLTHRCCDLYQQAAMVGFLDLPSELVFNIIDLVLSSPTVLPNNGTRHRPSYPTGVRNLCCVPSLHYLKGPGVSTLLLTSQRMYRETKEYLSKAPRNFEVDIAVIDDHWFWPTRRVIPARELEGTIERLEINITPCCTTDGRHLQTDWDHEGRFPVDLSTFWLLLAGGLLFPLALFLLDDSSLPNASSKRHRSQVFWGLETWVDPLLDEHLDDGRNIPVTRIDTVTINIDTWRYGNGNKEIGLAEIPFRKIKGLAHLDFRELYPVDFAKSETYLRELIRYIDERLYGTGKVGEKIGKIQFYLDGKLSRELNTVV